jgi:hypothetical protein
MIQVLKNAGIPESIQTWVKSFIMTPRAIKVRTRTGSSNWRSSKVGLPQGGPLSPFLYVLYLNSLLNLLTVPDIVQPYVYADDVGLLIVANKRKDLIQRIKMVTEAAISWTKKNKAELSWDKVKVLGFGVNLKDQEVQLDNGLGAKAVRNLKLLGIIVDSRLAFRLETERLRSKVLERLGWIKRITKGWEPKKRRLVVQAMLTSVMSYSIGVIAGFLSDANYLRLNRVMAKLARTTLGALETTNPHLAIYEAEVMTVESMYVLEMWNTRRRWTLDWAPQVLKDEARDESYWRALEILEVKDLVTQDEVKAVLRLKEWFIVRDWKPEVAELVKHGRMEWTKDEMALFRIRSAQARTKDWLYRHKQIAEEEPCRYCRMEQETLHHLLLLCPTLQDTRENILGALVPPNITVETIEDIYVSLLKRPRLQKDQVRKEKKIADFCRAIGFEP